MNHIILKVLKENASRILSWSQRLNRHDSSPAREAQLRHVLSRILDRLASQAEGRPEAISRDYRSPEMRFASDLVDLVRDLGASEQGAEPPGAKPKRRRKTCTVNGEFLNAMIDFTKTVFLEFWQSHAERLVLEHEGNIKRLRMNMVSAQDTERKRLASILHDDVIQSLASMLIETQMIRSNLNGKPSDLRSEMTRLEQKIRDTITTCRLLTLDMESFWLQKAGLLPALSAYLRQCENRDKTTIRFTPKITSNVCWTAQVTVMHVVQEALNNIRKHAKASSIDITLECDEKRVYLSVFDDGKGFNTDLVLGSSSPEHFGLTLLCERLKLANGTLKVTSKKGSGTRLEAWIPNEPEQVVSISERKGSAWIRPEY